MPTRPRRFFGRSARVACVCVLVALVGLLLCWPPLPTHARSLVHRAIEPWGKRGQSRTESAGGAAWVGGRPKRNALATAPTSGHATTHLAPPSTPRTQESLKHATAPLQASQSLPGSLDLRGGQPPAQEHRSALRALARAALDRAPSLAVTTSPRPALALAFLPVLKGVPAPYTGVKALSDAAGVVA